jgi:hypothetical protein
VSDAGESRATVEPVEAVGPAGETAAQSLRGVVGRRTRGDAGLGVERRLDLARDAGVWPLTVRSVLAVGRKRGICPADSSRSRTEDCLALSSCTCSGGVQSLDDLGPLRPRHWAVLLCATWPLDDALDMSRDAGLARRASVADGKHARRISAGA